jgi:hypothetical protein
MIKIARTTIEISRDMHVSADKLWNLITDTSRWIVWGPSIRAVDSPDQFIHKGSRGRVKVVFGLWLNFRITELEAGRYWSWSVSGIHATGHRIEMLDNNTCRLVFEVPLFAAPYIIICQLALKRIASILEH